MCIFGLLEGAVLDFFNSDFLAIHLKNGLERTITLSLIL